MFFRIAIASAVVAMLSAVETQELSNELEARLQQLSRLNETVSIQYSGYALSGSRRYEIREIYKKSGEKFSFSRLIKVKGSPDYRIEHRFNGALLATQRNRDSASWYELSKLIETQPNHRYIESVFLDAVGLSYNSIPSVFNAPLRSQILFLRDHEFTVEELATSKGGVRIRIQGVGGQGKYISSKEELGLVWNYELLPSENYAVNKLTFSTEDGRVLARYTNREFRPVPGSELSFPSSVQATMFIDNFSKEFKISTVPLTTFNLNLDHILLEKLGDEEFEFDKTDVAAGAHVVDASNPDLVRNDGSVITYNMPASADDLDAAISSARGNMPERNSPILRTAVLAVLAVLAIAGFAFGLRGFRKSSP